MGGVNSEIPAWRYFDPNRGITVPGTVAGGQFDWGGRLLKSNGGAQRLAQRNGNPLMRVKAKASLTARPTSRAETKVGLSDPTALSGRAVAYRIKATPGITG